MQGYSSNYIDIIKATRATTNNMGRCAVNLFSLANSSINCVSSLGVKLWSTDLCIMTIEMTKPSFLKYGLFNHTDKRVTLEELFIYIYFPSTQYKIRKTNKSCQYSDSISRGFHRQKLFSEELPLFSESQGEL